MRVYETTTKPKPWRHDAFKRIEDEINTLRKLRLSSIRQLPWLAFALPWILYHANSGCVYFNKAPINCVQMWQSMRHKSRSKINSKHTKHDDKHHTNTHVILMNEHTHRHGRTQSDTLKCVQFHSRQHWHTETLNEHYLRLMHTKQAIIVIDFRFFHLFFLLLFFVEI